jgi:hypothetical protein
MPLTFDVESPLAVIINAVKECRDHLKKGNLKKALAELDDPLFQNALKDIELLRDEVSAS